MVLKPQDILAVLKLLTLQKQSWNYACLGVQLGMSPSQLHASVKRVLKSQLAVKMNDAVVPQLRNLEEFIVHGMRYVFVPERGELTRGMPTAWAAQPLVEHFQIAGEVPPVWPDKDGDVRGEAFSPIYKLAPRAAQMDDKLYELLVIIDAIRGGRARERKLAIDEFRKRLDHYASME
jgi:hypothetical protein